MLVCFILRRDFMKKSTKLLFGIAVALVLMISCAFTVLAYSDSECPHNDYYYDSNYGQCYCYDCSSYYVCPHNDYYYDYGEFFCNDCDSYFWDESLYNNMMGFDENYYGGEDYYYDDTSSSTGDFGEFLPIAIGAVVITLLAPWIILGIIIFGLFIPTLVTIITTLIAGIILFIIGAIIFILTPVIILVGVPGLVISLI
jgi:hypothetical protein